MSKEFSEHEKEEDVLYRDDNQERYFDLPKEESTAFLE